MSISSMKTWLAVTALLVTGCAATPPTQFYLLDALSTPATPSPSKPKHVLGIGPLAIPAVLERKQIVTRGAGNQIIIAEFGQWAAPLKQGITEILGQNLSRLLPSDSIRVYPWHAYHDVQYRVIIEIIRFDTTPTKTANLEANWSVMDEQNRHIVSSGHSLFNKPLNDASYPATVLALSHLLADFSQQLAENLVRLDLAANNPML